MYICGMYQATEAPTTPVSDEPQEEQQEQDKRPVSPSLEPRLEKELKSLAQTYLSRHDDLILTLAQIKFPTCLSYVLRVLPLGEARRWRSSRDLYGAIFQQPSDTAKALECLRVLDLFTNLYSLYLITRKAKGKLKSKLLQV